MRHRILVVMTGLFLTTGTVGLAPSATTALAARTAPSAPTSTCGGGGHRWYTWAQSGTGTLKGTGAWARTWAHWSVAGHRSGFSDEAVWIIDSHHANNALEVGFLTGLGQMGFSNKMYMYYTIKDGASEHDTFTELPKNTVIWMSASSNGRRSWAFVMDRYLAKGIHYGVAGPRLTYEQAEVNFHDIPMAGGGVGSPLLLEYESAKNLWLHWRFVRGGRQRPYKIKLAQPDRVVEGGNGSHCQ